MKPAKRDYSQFLIIDDDPGIAKFLVTYLRQRGHTCSVFTGVGYDEEQMHAALHAGANGYVSKNLPIEQLYCVLARILATCQQRKPNVTSNGQQSALAGAA